MEQIVIPLSIIAVAVVVVALMVSQLGRAADILSRWAQDNNYEILASERRWLRLGPFFWTTSRGQYVYYVTVRLPDGQEKQGWVRCGGWFLGVLTNDAEVRWDE